MTPFQKIIKYCAWALAIVLIVMIVTGILNVIGLIAGISYIDGKLDDHVSAEFTDLDAQPSKDISIQLSATRLTVKYGDEFKISTNNSKIKASSDKDKLIIKEASKTIISKGDTRAELIIQLPRDHSFDEFELEAGAGIVFIEGLTAKSIDLELGAGNTEIKNLTVTGKTEIDGGAGNIKIDGTANRLDLDLGIGKLELKAKLTGKNQINSGVGNSEITLIGSRSDYDIKVNKGIGSASIDNTPSEKYTNSPSEDAADLHIDCGIGNVDIDFAAE